MNNNQIDAAKDFECTHGRINDFLVQLYKNPETNQIHWRMVFAGSANVCPPEFDKVFESPQGYANAKLCRDAATKESRKLSDESFDYYLAQKNVKIDEWR